VSKPVKEKKPAGRHTIYNAEFHPLLVESMARNGLTDIQMSKKLKISERTLNNWKEKYPEFMQSIKKGKQTPDEMVENSLFKRAIGYKYDEVTKERIVDTGQNKRHGGASSLTAREWEYAQDYFGNECCYCGKTGKMTKDHLIALSSGGKLTASNVVPACGGCNSAKKDNEAVKWYKTQPFYTKERQEKIEEYIKLIKTKVDNESVEVVITKIVTKELPPETLAGIFWLKNRKPKEWRDRQENNVVLTGTVETVDITEGMSFEDRKKLAIEWAKKQK
jgi:hypothetical protein